MAVHFALRNVKWVKLSNRPRKVASFASPVQGAAQKTDTLGLYQIHQISLKYDAIACF